MSCGQQGAVRSYEVTRSEVEDQTKEDGDGQSGESSPHHTQDKTGDTQALRARESKVHTHTSYNSSFVYSRIMTLQVTQISHTLWSVIINGVQWYFRIPLWSALHTGVPHTIA